MPGQSQKSQMSPSLRVRNHSLRVIQSLLKVSESDDDVSPPVTSDAPARKRVCFPVAAASQTSVHKPNLDISDIGRVYFRVNTSAGRCVLATSRSKQRSNKSNLPSVVV